MAINLIIEPTSMAWTSFMSAAEKMNLAKTHPNIDYVAIAGLIGVFDDVFLRNIRELLN